MNEKSEVSNKDLLDILSILEDMHKEMAIQQQYMDNLQKQINLLFQALGVEAQKPEGLKGLHEAALSNGGESE